MRDKERERDAYFYITTKTAKSTFLECTHAEIYKKRFNWTEDGTVASFRNPSWKVGSSGEVAPKAGRSHPV